MKKKNRNKNIDGRSINTVSRTVYWKAVRDIVNQSSGKNLSHTYVRECANGIKSVNDETYALIKKAMESVPLIPVNRRVHERA